METGNHRRSLEHRKCEAGGVACKVPVGEPRGHSS